MRIQRALILCKDQKTDDELKAIMATHPWAPALIHGFYKSFGEIWDECYGAHSGFDAIWIDAGLTLFDPDRKWIVENFHSPGGALELFQPSTDLLGEYERHKCRLQYEWWEAIVRLITHQIPANYWAYGVYYGEIEDDFDNAEQAWRDSFLGHFDYSPEAQAALGNAASMTA
jgi:hypothetical protein